MLTLEKMIGQLEEAININSDDTVFSDRLFIDLINQARAVFIRQDLNKKRTADPTIIKESHTYTILDLLRMLFMLFF